MSGELLVSVRTRLTTENIFPVTENVSAFIVTHTYYRPGPCLLYMDIIIIIIESD